MAPRRPRRAARWVVAAAVGLMCGVGAVAGASPAAADDILDCQFGTAQVFDVQRDMTGTTLSVWDMKYPHSNFHLFAPDAPPTRFDATTLDPTDYFSFFPSTTVRGTLGLAVFSADGTRRGVIHETGVFWLLGDTFLYYVGSGAWDTLVTTQEGFSYGDAASFTVTNSTPTMADVLGYQECRSSPVALPVILAGTPPDGTVGQTYQGFTVPVAGSASFAYAVAGGALPDGLTLGPATGTISGVPTTAGTFTFTVAVTGPTGTATASYTVTIAPVGDPPTSPPSPGAVVPTLPATGTSAGWPVVWLAGVAAVAGFVLVTVGRRARH